jgi:hypothetical protein
VRGLPEQLLRGRGCIMAWFGVAQIFLPLGPLRCLDFWPVDKAFIISPRMLGLITEKAVTVALLFLYSKIKDVNCGRPSTGIPTECNYYCHFFFLLASATGS